MFTRLTMLVALLTVHMMAMDITQALKLSKQTHVPVVVYAYKQGCPWCKQFEETILSDQKIQKLLKQKTIFVAVDFAKTKIPYVQITPTTLILNDKGDLIAPPISGCPADPQETLEFFENVVENYR